MAAVLVRLSAAVPVRLLDADKMMLLVLLLLVFRHS
jgi:hypothetical protein